MSLRALRPVVTAVAALALFSGQPAFAQTNAECLVCHAEPSLTMEKRGRTVSLYVDARAMSRSAHGDLECVSCHEGFKPDRMPHAQRITNVNCLSCHGEEGFINFGRSVHGVSQRGAKPAASCADCHTTHSIQRITAKEPAERKLFAEKVCSKCHAAVSQNFMQSDHGVAMLAGIKGAPTCVDCHGEHTVSSPLDEEALTSHGRQARMCLSCHQDKPEVRERVGPSAGFVSSYENSVHGQAVKGGSAAAATCSDCHGSHEMRKGSNPASKVARKNIASTCGRCHGDIQEQYVSSIHGSALAAGIDASATCTDCHGEHNILSPRDPRSPVAATNVSAQVCSPCHSSVRLTEKYGLAGDRFQSFADSYHGLAGRAGSVEVANCASCHGVHDIKPSGDPSSRIHKDNLVRTCGTCHPGANVNFTKGSVHVTSTAGREDILYFISSGYILLIALVIGGMLVHNVLDFLRKSNRQLMYRRGILPREHVAHRLYVRMSLNERIQHGTLLGSFLLLVLTGFALKFPEAWWVVPIRDVSPLMFELRGILHRIAGVVLVAVSLYHLYYILFVPRGKQLIRDLLPVRSDIADAFGVFKYNVGLSKTKPLFGRFSYIEKSEYWALIWGTVVMALTGVILWFDNTFLGLLTKLGWDIARTVHYYEAWLATLAILVWHFYFVIFNPDTYPLNLAFWKGTLTEEEMSQEHPLELQEIRRREIAEKLEEVQGESGVEGVEEANR